VNELPKPRTKVLGVPAKRGTIMRTGKAWRLISPGERVFKATLVKKVKIGDEAVASFRVWNLPD
jgi:hypothetical protein